MFSSSASKKTRTNKATVLSLIPESRMKEYVGKKVYDDSDNLLGGFIRCDEGTDTGKINLTYANKENETKTTTVEQLLFEHKGDSTQTSAEYLVDFDVKDTKGGKKRRTKRRKTRRNTKRRRHR